HVLNLISEAVIKPFNKAVASSKKVGDSGEGGADAELDSDEELVSQSDDEADDGSSDVADHEDDAFSQSLHPSQDQDTEDDRLIRQALASRHIAYFPTAESSTEKRKAASKNQSDDPRSALKPTAEAQAGSCDVGVQIRQLAWFARKLRYNVRLRISFQQTCSNFELPRPHTLIRDVATRWNSTFQMINRALVLWDAIVSWQEHNHKIVPAKFRIRRTHKSGFEQIVSLLKPLDDATFKFSAKKTPTIGDVLGTYEELDAHFRAVEENDDVGEVWREAARRASAVAAEYYGLTDDSIVYYLAVMLHPQMKRRFMEVMGWEASWMDRAEQTLRETFDSHYRSDEPETVQPLGKNGQLLDPLKWWADQARKGNDHGGLAALALDVFAAPATSVDVERLFSKAGNHITPLRHRLKAIKIGEMVSVGAWFREGWVPKDLLADFCFAQQQRRLSERNKKRAQDAGDAEPTSPTKRMRPDPAANA
ncbi:unnamed protein product, partial [Tilletia controversa]